MGIRYPGSNMQELNLDWVLSTVKENTEKVNTQLHDLTELEEKVDSAVYSVDHMTVEANTLQPEDDATATKSIINGHINIEFGIPKGEQGEQGIPGQDGRDGQDGAPGTPATDAQVQTAVNAWLTNNVDPDSGYVLDSTLTQALAAAPADLVGYIKANIAPEFSTSTNYSIGKLVWYNNSLWQFYKPHSAGAWTGTDVSTAGISALIESLFSDVSLYFDETQAYNVGDYVVRFNLLYRFTSAHTANTAWDSSEVQRVRLANELADLKSQLFDLTDDNFVNGFDNMTNGYYLTGSGTLAANAQYCVSDYVPVKQGELVLYCGKNPAAGLSYLWGYTDTEGNGAVQVVSPGTVDGLKIITIPSGVNYIRAMSNGPAYTSTEQMLIHGKNVLFYDSSMGSIRTFFNTYVNNPSRYNKYTVYVLAGTYSFDSEFTAAELADTNFKGVFVPAWTTLKAFLCSGSVTFSLAFANANSHISTLNMNIGSCLDGINVTGNKTLYAIHDDFSKHISHDEHIYNDCVITATDCANGYAYGGGCMAGSKYLYNRCKFIGTNYDGGGYLMHSNTGFSQKTVLVFNDCEFDSQNGHPERAVNIRGLGNNSIVNEAYFNNCKLNGMYLQKNTVFDWSIQGSGNSKTYIQQASSDCVVDFADTPMEITVLTASAYSALPVGSMGMRSGVPVWWSGTAWIDSSGSPVT